MGFRERKQGDPFTAVGFRDDRKGNEQQIWQSQKSRGIKSALDLSVSVTNSNRHNSRPQVSMAKNEPHPTRYCQFEWKPVNKTLRITLTQGTRRHVKWTRHEGVVGPKHKAMIFKSVDGPSTSLEVEAQPIDPGSESLEIPDKSKGSLVNQFCVGEASNTKSGDLETSSTDLETSTSAFENNGKGIKSEWLGDASLLELDADDEMDSGVLMTHEKLELEFQSVEEGHGLEL